MRIMLSSLTISYILIGYFTFIQLADYSVANWKTAYYAWDKLGWVLMSLCIIRPTFNKQLKNIWKCIAAFYLIRFVWEIVESLFGYKDASHPSIIFILYLITVLLICIIILIPLIQKCRR